MTPTPDLYYYGARYYDDALGRFITADSNSGSTTDPQSLNRYIYARDNPMSFVDPTGHIFIIPAGNYYCSDIAPVTFTNTNTVTTTTTVQVSSTTTVIMTTQTTTSVTYHAGQVTTSSTSAGSRQVLYSAPKDQVLSSTSSGNPQTSYDGGCTSDGSKCIPDYQTNYLGGPLGAIAVSSAYVVAGVLVADVGTPAAIGSGYFAPHAPLVFATGLAMVAGGIGGLWLHHWQWNGCYSARRV